jgi:hypothetical protein
MIERISRKQFLSGAAGYLTTAAAGSAAWSLLSKEPAISGPVAPSWPWPYARLDMEEARRLGHDGYYEYGCGYAGFAGIVKALQDKAGAPFTGVPLQMMSFGSGGLKGWGTICGALNGASAAISLVSDTKTAGLLIDELTNWYTQALLPGDIGNRIAESRGYAVDKGIKALPQNRSGSPLCHISVTKWCAASRYAVDSPERLERCARVSGDVAAQAVKLLNDQSLGTFRAEHTPPKSVAECMSCHGAGRAEKNVSTKMECVKCHHDVHKK